MSDTASGSRRTRPVRWRVLIGVGALVVVAVGGLFLRWWTHPTLFGDLGDGFVSKRLPVDKAALSTTVIFPQVDGEEEMLRIDDVHATLSTNTAEAALSYWVCHMGPDEDLIGGVHHPENSCADIEPWQAGQVFHYGVWPDSDYLFVTLTPTKAGVAHLTDVEVDYARGRAHLWQRGTESIRVDRKIRVR